MWIGNIRGWTLQKLGIKLSWKGAGGGILLAAVSYAATYGVWTIYELIIPPGHLTVRDTNLAIPVIISTVIINSVFEEVVEAGYFIHTFSRFGMCFAILAGALLRELYHLPLMQMEALLGIFPAFLMFGYVYWRWRQLWPLVVAHTLRNLYFYLIAIHHAP
jgi:membrane protease YdiL (CAAX protease family)